MDLQYMTRNNSDLSISYIQRRPDVSVPYLTLMSCLMLIGCIGNTFVIGSVLVNKQLRKVSNVFIVNLSIADLCVTAFVDPFSIVGFVNGEQWFDDKMALCEIVASVCLTSCFCSLLSIAAISFNRYIHICHNHIYMKVFTLRNAILMAVGLWVVSFLAEMPNFFGWGDYGYDKKLFFCMFDRTADHSFNMFFVCVGIAVPVVSIIICYILIYVHVRRSRIKVNAQTGSNSNKDQKNSVKLVRTFFIIFVVFAVCWTPYALFITIDRHDQLSEEYYTFAVLLAHSSSSLNGLLYGATNMQFRRGYIQFLNKIGCGRLLCCSKINRNFSDTGTATEMSQNRTGQSEVSHRDE